MSQSGLLSDALDLQSTLRDWAEGHPLLTDREIVESGLLLTLVDPTADEIRSAFDFYSRFGTTTASEFSVIPATKQQQLWGTAKQLRDGVIAAKDRFAEKWWQSTDSEREWFRGAMDLAIRDIPAARKALKSDITEGLKQILIVPRLIWTGRQTVEDLIYFGLSLEGVFALILARVLDAKGEFGEALRKCRFCECAFLAYPPPSGGPRPSYCKPEHRAIAVRQTGAERTQRWRERKAKDPK